MITLTKKSLLDVFLYNPLKPITEACKQYTGSTKKHLFVVSSIEDRVEEVIRFDIDIEEQAANPNYDNFN